jgi:hypothetical protein
MSIKTDQEIKALGERISVLEQAINQLTKPKDNPNAENDRQRASKPR